MMRFYFELELLYCRHDEPCAWV